MIRGARLHVEQFEDRVVPAGGGALPAYIVNVPDDTAYDHYGLNVHTGKMEPLDANGNTSLRAVVTYANQNPLSGAWNTNHYDVDLSPVAGQTITLNPDLAFRTLVLNTNFNFLANAGNVTIARGDVEAKFNHFDVSTGVECHWTGITLYNGSSTADGGSIWNNGTAQFTNCTFEGNSTGGNGGAIATRLGATTIANNCEFLFNFATTLNGNGGAVAALSGSSVTNLTNCTLTENETVGNGGAVWAEGAASLLIDGCSITWNRATGTSSKGGGVYVESTTSATINQTNITDNTSAWLGGGLYVLDCNLTMTGGSLANNTSASDGGGFYIDADGKTVTFDQVSITNNTATDGKGGGGYLSHGTVTGSLTALTGNSAGRGLPGIGVSLNAHEYRDLTIPAGQQTAERDE
jgi:predicted outer membrane repeat protein